MWLLIHAGIKMNSCKSKGSLDVSWPAIACYKACSPAVITVAIILVVYLQVKLLYIIWKSGTRWVNQRVPDLSVYVIHGRAPGCQPYNGCPGVCPITRYPLQWRHNERDGVSSHQPHDCLLNRLFKAQIKENIKAPRHWPLRGEFTGDRWIPRTKGQQRGKCFHLMTSSCHVQVNSDPLQFNFSKSDPNGRRFSDNIFKFIYLKEDFCFWI